jgi:hypothetical protein
MGWPQSAVIVTLAMQLILWSRFRLRGTVNSSVVSGQLVVPAPVIGSSSASPEEGSYYNAATLVLAPASWHSVSFARLTLMLMLHNRMVYNEKSIR